MIVKIIYLLWTIFIIFALGFAVGRSVGIHQVKKIIDKI